MTNTPNRTDRDEAATASVEPETLVRVGFVFRPHGVHGELKVDPESDDPTRFEAFETIYIGPRRREVQAFTVTSCRYQETKRGTTVILQLAEVESRTDAEGIMKQTVFVSEDVLDLDEDEVFIHDLVGLDVVTEDGTSIGMLSNVLTYPAHDMLVVHRPGQSEALIPVVEDIVLDMDLDAERVVIRPIEGLLD
jgi:16S rRNA processing protein RimM